MKKKQKVLKVIDWAIYPFDVLFTYGTTEKEIIRFIEKMYDLDEEEKSYLNFQGKSGRTVMLKGGQTIMWVNNPKNYAIINHEIFHAVTFLFNKIGIVLSESSDEAWAYAIEYLTRKIYETL
jgi:hypothetical protein